MAIIMGKDCIEAIYGLMGWKGLNLSILDVGSIWALHMTTDWTG